MRIYQQFFTFINLPMLKQFRQKYPKFKYMFTFQQFNQVQRQCYPKIFNSSQNMIVSAPTSAGKTVLFQLLIAKLMNQSKTKCLYLAPIKSLCHEKFNSWKKKFLSNMKVMELTGDTLEMEYEEFSSADIYVATPEKIDYISRKNLGFLKELNLLLIDEIHMLNMEDRGAILEAIVSRIMSINKKIRIMAVSATIPNIKEVAQWLKVPQHLICVFGEQYRPAKLNKVVLGFKSANNDFNFEKMLNFKILDVIRHYSYGRGTLIFCQTQKGTQQACNKIVSQAREREFIDNQVIAMQLINTARMADNHTLKFLLPHGVAFHNASLSMKDRSIVQGLFLDFKIKVLCTTSTLAMGINLPARLVIIKSTKCYKGSGKGYQEYTQIQLDQMMGRAGRIPFDKEGTVVIMTEKGNYNKYAGVIKLENLESQLYYQFIDHLNTEISLKSIQNLSEARQYLKNSFCYIRMQNSQKIYKLSNKSQVDTFVHQACLDSIKKLSQYQIIQYIEMTQKIHPRQCSYNISKNAIEVETIIRVIQAMSQVKNQREFLSLLCTANELAKYRSKLDERKSLKELNEKNRYTLKEAISSAQKKSFVMIQAQLSGIYIDNWELRKQANQSIYFFKRLSYCVRNLALERRNSGKTFWLYLFGCLFHKYFSQGFWESNEDKVLKQIKKVASKWKNIQARGIRSLNDLVYGLNKLDIFGSGMSSAAIKQAIEDEIKYLNGSLQISVKKAEDESTNKQNLNLKNISAHSNHILKLIFTESFNEKFRSINIIIQHNHSIYHTGILNQQNLQFTVCLKNTLEQKYFIAIIKDNYVGFDEFYWFECGKLRKTEMKREQNLKKLAKSQSLSTFENKKRSEKKLYHDEEEGDEMYQIKKRPNSLQSMGKIPKQKQTGVNKKIPRQINYISKKIDSNALTSEPEQVTDSQLNDFLDTSSAYQSFQKKNQNNIKAGIPGQEQLSSTMKMNKKSKQLKLTQNFSTIKRKYIYDEQFQSKKKEQDPLAKSLKKAHLNKESQFRDLKSFNWKPGFQQIKDSDDFCNDQDQDLFFVDGQISNTMSNTKPIQKKKKCLLLSEESDSQETQKQNQNFLQGGVIVELNKYMNQRIKNPVVNKISQNQPFEKNVLEKKEKINSNFKNQKTLPFQEKYIPAAKNKKITDMSLNPKRENDLFGHYLKKKKESKTIQDDHRMNQSSNYIEKSKKIRQVPTPQKQSKKDLAIRKPFIDSFECVTQRPFVQRQEKKQKKEYKNPYEYFGSVFTDDDEDY